MVAFGFKEWPFANVPTLDRGVSLWADRSNAKAQIDAIMDDWLHTQRSTITLMWADLGSGKTHTLYNLRARCEQSGSLSCSYVLLPTAITDFLGLYRAISRELDWEKIGSGSINAKGWTAAALKKVLTWFSSTTDVIRQNLAQRWLTAEKLRVSECQMLGIAKSITTPEEAVEVLAVAINSLIGGTRRFVLMIDEYQRVAEGKRKHLNEIGHGIHTLYNACPNRFSLVFSCATGMSDDYTMVLTPEVVSRLSPKRIELPYLSADDIVCYIRDLFIHYREEKVKHDSVFFPLSEGVVRQFADFLVNGLGGETTPRRINEAFDDLLSHMRRNNLSAVKAQEFAEWLKLRGPELIKQIGQ